MARVWALRALRVLTVVLVSSSCSLCARFNPDAVAIDASAVTLNAPKPPVFPDAYAEATYTVYPRIDTRVCSVTNNSIGPTLLANGLSHPEGFAAPLPDLSEWSFAGTARVGKEDAYVWKSGLRVDDKVNTYSFFVTQAGHPLKLHMMGLNLMTGSHYDEYLVEFKSFSPGPLATTAFEPPKVCQHPVDPHNPEDAAYGANEAAPARMAGQALALLPSSIAAAGLLPSSRDLAGVRPTARQQRLRANLQFVDRWNTDSSEEQGYRLTLNKFAAWSDEHFASTMLGTASPHAAGTRRTPGGARPSTAGASTATGRAGSRPLVGRPGHGTLQPGLGQQLAHGPAWLGEYERVWTDSQLPESVDWRGTPADGSVKDQASCGSCWAFAAVGTLQAAWYNATGEALSLSEQQLVDCSWRHHNGGCGGGWPAKAIEYVARSSPGMLQGEAYPYRGANDFCRAGDGRAAARFSGYKTIRAKDERAVMEALALHGPLAVSMNAAHPTFKFYSEGVYFREDCGSTPDFMDHAVVLSGYGTDPKTGKDYWLIRNSWSTFWGSNGYAKIARKGNDCGVSLEAVLAVVDEPAAAAARERVYAAHKAAAAV